MNLPIKKGIVLLSFSLSLVLTIPFSFNSKTVTLSDSQYFSYSSIIENSNTVSFEMVKPYKNRKVKSKLPQITRKPTPTSTPPRTPTPTPTPTLISTPRQQFDTKAPLYKVYKGGFEVNVPSELQWYIRDMCQKYGFTEKYIYGMILCESTFKPEVNNGNCIGLCQINKYWISSRANLEHFTSDFQKRDLRNAYDNLLTLCEMWCYAKAAYHLDLLTEDGMMRVLYWHSTGKDPTKISSSKYFNIVKKYANELVPLQ